MSIHQRLSHLEQRILAIEKAIRELRGAPRQNDKDSISPQQRPNQYSEAAIRQPSLADTTTDRTNKANGHRNNREPWWRRTWAWEPWNRGFIIAAGLAGVGYAAITYLQWCDLRHNFKVDQRAWVGVKGITLLQPLAANIPMKIELTVGNTGKTPALDSALKEVSVSGSEKPFRVFYGEKERMVVAPGNTDTYILTSSPVPPDWVTAYENNIANLYIRGALEYRDIFGSIHRTTFCAHYPAPVPLRFADCTNGSSME